MGTVMSVASIATAAAVAAPPIAARALPLTGDALSEQHPDAKLLELGEQLKPMFAEWINPYPVITHDG